MSRRREARELEKVLLLSRHDPISPAASLSTGKENLPPRFDLVPVSTTGQDQPSSSCLTNTTLDLIATPPLPPHSSPPTTAGMPPQSRTRRRGVETVPDSEDEHAILPSRSQSDDDEGDDEDEDDQDDEVIEVPPPKPAHSNARDSEPKPEIYVDVPSARPHPSKRQQPTEVRLHI